ncbi:MAG: hypothetical protein RML36_14495, partial [Anaerolineae bacterium]|nr:hypothetical protein [Anaerolineae bacterium]
MECYENGGGPMAEFRWELASASARCTVSSVDLEQRVEGCLGGAIAYRLDRPAQFGYNEVAFFVGGTAVVHST